MSLKAVFFDFGGTIDHYPEIREDGLIAAGKIMSLLNNTGIQVVDKYSVVEYFDQLLKRFSIYKVWKKETLVELPTQRVWKEYILFDEPNKDNLDAETAEELTFLVETGRYTRYARPEMREVMEELVKTKLKFGIISNVVSLTQVPRNLVDYGLESYFTKIILSSGFGKVKPDPDIFHHAAESFGLRPDECIYVGNSPSKDVFGAKNAGYMAAVQIEYVDDSDDTTDKGVEPDHYIRSMRELPDIINSYL
ncbi:MAG: hypothetical protein DRP60_02400 [Spirochaetes bacterium]|nr:MAG: hypothetical protein DRP60_02400 [Spirochaetota bacterium]